MGLSGWLKEKMHVWRILPFKYLEPLSLLYPANIVCESRQVRFSMTINILQLSHGPFVLTSRQTSSGVGKFLRSYPPGLSSAFQLLWSYGPSRSTHASAIAEEKARESSLSGDVKIEAETGGMYPQANECQRLPRATRSWNRPGKILLKEPEHGSADALVSSSSPSEHERINS